MIRWGCRHPCSPARPANVTPTGYRYCDACYDLIEAFTDKRSRPDDDDDDVLVPGSPRADDVFQMVAMSVEDTDVCEYVFALLLERDPRFMTMPVLQQVLNHIQSRAYFATIYMGYKEKHTYEQVIQVVCEEYAQLAREQNRALGLETSIVSIPKVRDRDAESIYWHPEREEEREWHRQQQQQQQLLDNDNNDNRRYSPTRPLDYHSSPSSPPSWWWKEQQQQQQDPDEDEFPLTQQWVDDEDDPE